jgi:Fuc2NAc and GlcNAc transferase
VLSFFLLITALSAALTALIRHYAISKNVLDIPNARSSHTAPTPRGGGLAIVLAFAVAVELVYQQLSQAALLALAASAGVAGVGFWDDHAALAARWRLLMHVVAALIVWFCLGDGLLAAVLSRFGVNSYTTVVWLLAAGCTVFALVWLLNLFNFMDDQVHLFNIYILFYI